MHNESKPKKTYTPSILYFDHFHICTAQIQKKRRNDENNKIFNYEIEVEGKARPFLCLWEDNKGCCRLYLKTRQLKRANILRLNPDVMVPDGEDSFIDCSRYFEYNKQANTGNKGPIDHFVWKKVKDRMTEFEQKLRDNIDGPRGMGMSGR